MAESKTAEQVRDEHLEILGPQLGPLYHALYGEVTWLHAKWQQYRALFAHSPERIELLNSVAGFFFRVIQDVLWDDIILHIARLTDPPRSVGKDNLTLLRLTEAVSEPQLAPEVAALVDRAQVAAEFAKTWRNRHLAHRDLALAIDGHATQLPGISREKIERALEAISSVLNKIAGHYWCTEVRFADFIAHDDAESVLYYLGVAVDAEKDARDRLLQRKPSA